MFGCNIYRRTLFTAVSLYSQIIILNYLNYFFFMSVSRTSLRYTYGDIVYRTYYKIICFFDILRVCQVKMRSYYYIFFFF